MTTSPPRRNRRSPLTQVCFLVVCGIVSTSARSDEPPRPDAALSAVRSHLEPLLQSQDAQINQVAWIDAPGAKAITVTVAFKFIDPRGDRQEAQGKLVLPASIAERWEQKVPLAYAAGYEWKDAQSLRMLGLGLAVATPLTHPLNPLSRTPNLDIAFLHIARSLPFIDDAKVIVMGGSAGGYTTLMLAAETFPLAGAIATTPPVNFGYNTEYFLANKDRLLATLDSDGKPSVPVLAAVCGALAPQVLTYYPTDREDPVWFEHSPIAHITRITCPVTVIFSTGDVLVPIDQVDPGLAQGYDTSAFPDGFKVAPRHLMKSDAGRRTLLGSLPRESYTVLHSVVPDGTVLLVEAEPDSPTPHADAPFDPAPQWNIIVLDEGPMRPLGGHFQYRFGLRTDGHITARLREGIVPEQLTLAKLQTLMDRYAGREWTSPRLRHLDRAEAERADVLRGLTTYVRCGLQHAHTLLQLYEDLPPSSRALGPMPRHAAPEEVEQHLSRLAIR